MEQLILIATIITIVSIIRKHKKRKPVRSRAVSIVQNKTSRNIPIVPASDFTKIIKQEQKERDKLLKEDLKRKEQLRTAKQKARTAWNDMQHYKQQQTDYMTVYNYYEKVYQDPDRSDKERQAAYLKKIALDNRIRTINRQIETAQNKIDNYERLAK